MSNPQLWVMAFGGLLLIPVGVWLSVDYHTSYVALVVIGALMVAAALTIGEAKTKKECAIGHYEKEYGVVMVGKIFMPTTYNNYVCEVWKK